MKFKNKNSVLLKTRVSVNDKIWWIHPEDDNGNLNEQQVERIKKHGNGPFKLLQIKEYANHTKLCFKNIHNVEVEEDSKYFTI